MAKAIEESRKREAVRMVVEGGLTVAQAAEQCGFGRSTLERALKEFHRSAPTEATQSERDELKRLRRENHP